MGNSTRYWLRQVSTDVLKVGLQQWIRDNVHYEVVENTNYWCGENVVHVV